MHNKTNSLGVKNIDKILEIISSCDCPFSASKILEKLDWDINKTTVYRNIEKLLKEEKILEDFSVSWEKLYSIKENHHHHFVCNICNKTENIWCFMNSEIQKLENKFNFKVKNHSLVLNWVCGKCT